MSSTSLHSPLLLSVVSGGSLLLILVHIIIIVIVVSQCLFSVTNLILRQIRNGYPAEQTPSSRSFRRAFSSCSYCLLSSPIACNSAAALSQARRADCPFNGDRAFSLSLRMATLSLASFTSASF